MPPVMGAAAFLIAEYVGITYAEVVKHAFVPAFLTYGALFYIVDIEAAKMGMRGLPRARTTPFVQSLLRALMTICSIIVLSGLVYCAGSKGCSAARRASFLARRWSSSTWL
jgi:TRAP-type uncharacterized transport system fused permease subunit